ncbi:MULTISPECIES: ABC transporter substrate-binding protein [Halorussus]|uniref:ABC transporter substrate-binding protein n=1 Tax=Halorussus TaxID=1070314 RepID=UPI000E216E47|nr:MULTISPECIES: ABC transporter substrate-binding protein [Halorussus]NHN61080.1 ABC transporter substrate-binding protein [Halorussus sp. JP-T4]
MSDDESPQTTRRKYLTAAGALAASGLIAGCTGGSGTQETTTAADTETTTAETTTAAETTTEEQETTTSGESYSVSMPPVGEVAFDGVPETWVANNGSWADMGVALGVEPPKAVWLTGRYHTQYYDGIDGVSVDKSDMVSLYQDGVSKELFYELDGDVHVIDPNFLMNRFKGWEQQDVDEVEGNIGPFFGNSIFSTGYQWHEGYPYLSLYDAFGKLAQAFQRTDRYDAFSALHDEFQTKVSDVVPSAESERPQVAIMWASGDEPESFSPYLIGDGTSFKQWRDLRVRDAFAETDVRDFHSTRGEVDYETLLKIDPDVLLLRGQEAKTAEEFRNTVVSFMKDHSVASSLTAVKNGDVYRGGPLYQGPITNLVLTERAARQVYGVDEQLFDRKRVADIVNGNL